MLEDQIRDAIARNAQHRKGARAQLSPPAPPEGGVPTLKPDNCRGVSPMLATRFAMFGRWQHATHGHWLSPGDMKQLWADHPADDLLARVKANRQASEENWPDEASALFRPERLSLFACSDITNETIYLLWLDSEEEPEFWVYDANGESRYKNLAAYLTAYLADDLSAIGRSWRA